MCQVPAGSKINFIYDRTNKIKTEDVNILYKNPFVRKHKNKTIINDTKNFHIVRQSAKNCAATANFYSPKK